MLLEPHLLNPPEEGRPADGAGFQQHLQRYLAVTPAFDEADEIFRDIGFGTAEADALGFGRTNALRLAFFDVFPLGFGDKGQNLQDQIGDKGSEPYR